VKISTSSEGNISLTEIYNPVELVASDEVLYACERDGVFEVVGRQVSVVPDNEHYFTDPRFCLHCGKKIASTRVCKGDR